MVDPVIYCALGYLLRKTLIELFTAQIVDRSIYYASSYSFPLRLQK